MTLSPKRSRTANTDNARGGTSRGNSRPDNRATSSAGTAPRWSSRVHDTTRTTAEHTLVDAGIGRHQNHPTGNRPDSQHGFSYNQRRLINNATSDPGPPVRLIILYGAYYLYILALTPYSVFYCRSPVPLSESFIRYTADLLMTHQKRKMGRHIFGVKSSTFLRTQILWSVLEIRNCQPAGRKEAKTIP